ncbi:MAG: hypothetical protein Q3992_06500 [Bacteroides sp.]|nr:hypothetical protein [Bacteroides sp.]
MDKYYVDINTMLGGGHEVHCCECSHLPNKENMIYLGFFSNCKEAIAEAKKHYENVYGCKHCCSKCHRN